MSMHIDHTSYVISLSHTNKYLIKKECFSNDVLEITIVIANKIIKIVPMTPEIRSMSTGVRSYVNTRDRELSNRPKRYTAHVIKCPHRQAWQIEKSKTENWRPIRRRRKYSGAPEGIPAFCRQYRVHFRASM